MERSSKWNDGEWIETYEDGWTLISTVMGGAAVHPAKRGGMGWHAVLCREQLRYWSSMEAADCLSVE